MLVIVLWFAFFGSKMKPPVPPPSPSAPAASTVLSASPSANSATAGSESSGSKPETKIDKETLLLGMEWTNRGGRLSKILLKNYHQDVRRESPPTNLLSLEGEESLRLVCQSCSNALPADDLYEEIPSSDPRVIIFRAEQNGLVIQKRYEWSEDQYLFHLNVSIENRSDHEFQGQVGLGWVARQFAEAPKKLGLFKGPSNQRSFLYKLGTKVTHVQKRDENAAFQGSIPWIGLEDRYFLISLISRQISNNQRLSFTHDGDRLNMALYSDPAVIPPQGRHEEQYSFYLGPKERGSLKIAGVGLEDAVDYGWFSLLAIPILELLKIFYMGVKNWGIAVILLTLFIKLVMNPLTIKSMKQMKAMQALQPKLQALKEKYKNDKQKLNLETMALFRAHSVNPVGGCLPMVLQMPIYIALYKVIYNAIELYHAPFFGFYKDLAAPDPYFILPILLGISMVAQQKLTPSASADPMQKQMMMIMPIMFTGFMLFLPMGLVLYIFVNTLFSVIQQYMYQNGIRWRDVLRGNFRPALIPPSD